MRSVLLIACLVLAGCLGTNAPQPGPGAEACVAQQAPLAPARHAPIDGNAAHSWVHQIVHLPNGDLRPRTPEDPEHQCTADWLVQALAADGWTTGRQDFSGADVQALRGNPASPWEDNCSDEEYDAVADMQLSNVWATWGEGETTLALAAHWDAKEDASDGPGPIPAANDGASGMGVILELQRALAAASPELGFRVAAVFFDAEDGFEDCHPLAGSFYFAQTMPIQIDRLILLDMVGDADARFPREGNSVESDEALVDLIWQHAEQRGMSDHFVELQRPVMDDHLPFIDVGVPSIDIIDFARPGTSFPPYWHTLGDDMSNIDPDMLGDMAALLFDVLQDPLFVAGWPS